MSSSAAKQRSGKNSGNSTSSEKGAHSNQPDDVAKKQQQQPPPTPAHSKGNKGGSPPSGGGKAASSCSCGAILNFLLSVTFLAAAAASGYYVHHLLGEVSQISLRQESFAKQREELARSLEGAVQKMQSLQSAFGGFELTLKNAQQKQEITEKTVRQGESEISRIGEVLQKLQNEILKDLSDGIHVVKDARERDFTSLENTVEERLTELTKSINDNIAEFTHIQKQSQDEINEVKKKVASLGETETYKHDLQVLKDAVDEMQRSLKTKGKTIETLQSTIDLMESDVLSEVKALVNLKQEHEKFKEVADTERLSLQTLEEKVLKAEEYLSHLPLELKKLSDGLMHIKSSDGMQDSYAFSKEDIESLQKSNKELESRLRSIEENVQAPTSSFAQNTEGTEAFIFKYDTKLAALEEGLDSVQSTIENDIRSLTDTVRSLGEAQLSIYGDVDELRRSLSDLPNNADALDHIQKQVLALLDQEKSSVNVEQSGDNKAELSSVKDSVDDVRSSLGQVESDLKMLRTAVDSLVAYSVKIETNENNVQTMKDSLDDIRNDLDRLFVKVEDIHDIV
ncbi:cytoskeleton-associated protein 4 [Thamnophis elegans]|uniref:cytoskeleton-associated protein 4 n=1 Tax=Thamnophis elegans TaxID=35005 RepID=UPI001377166D|nr:cytoskeleton-associated protein 4 [Thamnophis elegans]